MSRFHTTDFDFYPELAFRPRGRGSMTLEGGKGGSPAPDPNIGAYYSKMGDIAGEVWDKTKGLLPLQEEQMRKAIAAGDTATANAAEDRTYALGRQRAMDTRYDTIQVPLENQLIRTAQDYNEPVEQERMAQRAGEDVTAATSQAKGIMARGLAARGVRADSGAAVSAMSGMDLSSALASANAVNKTREAAKQIGWTRLGEAAALGKGLTGFGLASGAAASGSNGQGFQTGTSGLTSANSGISGINAAGAGASSIYGSAAGGLSNLYGQQVSAHNAEQANDPLGSILGAATGYGMKMLIGSDRRLKTDITLLGRTSNGLGLYKYRYKGGGPFHIGYMADEVAKVAPHAVVRGAAGGYDAVDYSKL